MANPFVHIELQTKDLAQAKTFYSQLFDWKLEDIPAPGNGENYTMIHVGEGTGGGMFSNPNPGVPPHWLAYVGVDDIRASTDKARARCDGGAGCDAHWRIRLVQCHHRSHGCDACDVAGAENGRMTSGLRAK